jgi:hypothetical protein
MATKDPRGIVEGRTDESISSTSSLPITDVLFNDPWGNKSDHSKGLFYQARRKYLYGETGALENLGPQSPASGIESSLRPNSAVNPLQPPDLFMTKAQVHRRTDYESTMRTVKSADVKGTHRFKELHFSEDNRQQTLREFIENKTGVIRPKKKKKINAAGKNLALLRDRKKVVYYDKFQSTNPRDWDEVLQAGVRLYVHRRTGRVDAECPYSDRAGHHETQPLMFSDVPDLGLDDTSTISDSVFYPQYNLSPGQRRSESPSHLNTRVSPVGRPRFKSEAAPHKESKGSPFERDKSPSRNHSWVAGDSEHVGTQAMSEEKRQDVREGEDIPIGDVSDPKHAGTGSLVYDSSEFDSLMELLAIDSRR